MPKLKIKVGLALLFTSLTLSGCGLKFNQNPNDQPKVKPHESLPPTFFQNANSNSQQQAEQTINLYLITKSLKQNYQKLFAVSLNESQSTINLKPVDKSVIRLIKYCHLKNTSAIKSWQQFVNGVNKTSISVTKNSHDPHAKLTIVDPKHPQQKLYTAQNGKTTYNRFK